MPSEDDPEAGWLAHMPPTKASNSHCACIACGFPFASSECHNLPQVCSCAALSSVSSAALPCLSTMVRPF